MVLRAQPPLGTIAQLFYFVAEEKKKTTKKTKKAFYDWATTGIPVIILLKLKRKWEFRGHFYFQPVRPQVVLDALVAKDR